MKKQMLSVVAGMLLLNIAACGYPTTEVKTTDSRPALTFEGAPIDAEIYIDDVAYGSVTDYAKKALIIEPGTHIVRIEQIGSVLHEEKIFVSGSTTKTITVK